MTPIVEDFFKQYAEALMSFSAEKIAAFYHTPMAVYSNQGVQTVAGAGEVVSFWKEGVKPYEAQQIKRAVPEVLSDEQLSENIFISKVRWKNYGDTGKEVACETNFYILSLVDGALKITGLVIMGM